MNARSPAWAWAALALLAGCAHGGSHATGASVSAVERAENASSEEALAEARSEDEAARRGVDDANERVSDASTELSVAKSELTELETEESLTSGPAAAAIAPRPEALERAKRKVAAADAKTAYLLSLREVAVVNHALADALLEEARARSDSTPDAYARAHEEVTRVDEELARRRQVASGKYAAWLDAEQQLVSLQPQAHTNPP